MLWLPGMEPYMCSSRGGAMLCKPWKHCPTALPRRDITPNDNDTQGDVFTRQPSLSRSLHNTYISTVRQKLQPPHSVIISSVCYEHQLSVGNLKLPVSMRTSTFLSATPTIIGSHNINRLSATAISCQS